MHVGEKQEVTLLTGPVSPIGPDLHDTKVFSTVSFLNNTMKVGFFQDFLGVLGIPDYCIKSVKVNNFFGLG